MKANSTNSKSTNNKVYLIFSVGTFLFQPLPFKARTRNFVKKKLLKKPKT